MKNLILALCLTLPFAAQSHAETCDLSQGSAEYLAWFKGWMTEELQESFPGNKRIDFGDLRVTLASTTKDQPSGDELKTYAVTGKVSVVLADGHTVRLAQDYAAPAPGSSDDEWMPNWEQFRRADLLHIVGPYFDQSCSDIPVSYALSEVKDGKVIGAITNARSYRFPGQHGPASTGGRRHGIHYAK